MTNGMKALSKVRPRILIVIGLVVGLVMIGSAYFELRQNKEDIFHLLTESTRSLSATIATSSINALNSSQELESLIAERLLNNARMLRTFDSLNYLTQNRLIQFANSNMLFRINVFDENGDRVLTNRVVEFDDHVHAETNVNRYKEVKPILTGETEEFVIGLKRARHVDEQRFAVAVARSHNKGAIVVNMNAEDYLKVRKKIGIEKIINDLGNHSEIEYIALQDTSGIIVSSSNLEGLTTFSEDNFLYRAKLEDSTLSRVTNFNDREIFETVKSLYYQGNFLGVFRIGVTLDEMRSTENRMIRRIVIISFILAAIYLILLSFVISTRNLDLIKKEYSNYKYFTHTFLQNMKESVFNVSMDLKITLFNNSAENLFSIKASEIIGKEVDSTGIRIFDMIAENIKLGNTYRTLELSFDADETTKFIAVNIIPNYNLNKILDSYTIIINDISEMKYIEEQSKRDEKLLAMGEFASSVAHEIRNPINSIGMIGQRLDREFLPQKSRGEYNALTKLLTEEVNRVNRIITQFLQYSKPLEMKLVNTDINQLMKGFHHLFIGQAEQRKISFNVFGDGNITAFIDPELFKQALVNLIQNAFEAVEDDGMIEVRYSRIDGNLIITIKDNGRGIPESERNKIFDLYYTTRIDGTGLGLAISQKIILQHGGVIDFYSTKEETIFKIKISLQ